MDFEKEYIKISNQVKKNKFKNYKYKSVRELIYAFLFINISLLFFRKPLVNFNINLLNSIGFSLYLPIFTIETMFLPIMIGKGTERLINHKNNNQNGIEEKIFTGAKELFFNDYITNYMEVHENYIEGKEISLPPKIKNLTPNELMEEIENIHLIQTFKKSGKKQEIISLDIILAYMLYLSLFPEVLYLSIFSVVGLGPLENTIILKLLFLSMGTTFSAVNAINYNKALENEKEKINKITCNSRFEKQDCDNLIKAYIMKTVKFPPINSIKEENKDIKNENVISNNKTKFTTITPKMVDYEFKGNLKEKRNVKVLERKK